MKLSNRSLHLPENLFKYSGKDNDSIRCCNKAFDNKAFLQSFSRQTTSIGHSFIGIEKLIFSKSITPKISEIDVLKVEKEVLDRKFSCFISVDSGTFFVTVLFGCIHITLFNKGEIVYHLFLSPHYPNYDDCFCVNNPNDNEKGIAEFNTLVYMGMIQFLAFYFYAKIEVVTVSKMSKLKTLQNEKIVNETNFDFKIIDSKWFREIVREESFAVRGHFRLQAFGIGLKERRLIYIKEFEKQGYKRLAKIASISEKK